MDALLNHKSIRKYKDTPIETDKLNAVLEAASRASTTGNMQVYSIVVTKDEQIRKQLWESHFKQDMVMKAPVHLTFCADFNRFTKWCEERNAKAGYDNFLSCFTAAIDALLAAQNAAIAAEKNGLGICYLGTVTWMADRFIDILKLPKLVVPVAAITLGYADENPGLTSRLPMEAIVHDEVYTDFTSDQINDIYRDLENMAETKAIVTENERENLAQVFTDKRYSKENNQIFSEKFLDVVARQGFMNNKE